MSNLGGQMGELRMTLQITRKETGKVEEVELINFLDESLDFASVLWHK